MRFLVDMGLSPRLAEWLRGEGYDADHLLDRGLARLPDAEIFALAAQERRTILTCDLDFGEIVSLSKSSEVSIVVFRLSDLRYARVTERLKIVLAQSLLAIQQGAVIVVEDARHRVRRLPIGS